jgi:hypothetical protein
LLNDVNQDLVTLVNFVGALKGLHLVARHYPFGLAAHVHDDAVFAEAYYRPFDDIAAAEDWIIGGLSRQ